MEAVEPVERLGDGFRGLATGRFVVGGLLEAAARAGGVAPLQAADAGLDPGLGPVGWGWHPVRIVHKGLFGVGPVPFGKQRFGAGAIRIRRNGIRAQPDTGGDRQGQSERRRHNNLPARGRETLATHAHMQAYSTKNVNVFQRREIHKSKC